MQFSYLLRKLRGPDFKVPHLVLGLDPGHTTGWSIFIDGKLVASGQSPTVKERRGNNEGKIDWKELEEIFKTFHSYRSTTNLYVVCEDYRVYAHKLERHTNSQVLTIRLIGAIDYICHLYDIPIYYQLASAAKGFCTDKKLKEWDFYDQAQRHSRDSIRHICYWLLFNKEISVEPNKMPVK